MAELTASVDCPECEQVGLLYHATIEYPDTLAPGVNIMWEHSCPRYEIVLDADGKATFEADRITPAPVIDDNGNVIGKPPYVGVFTIPGVAPAGS